MRFAARYQRAWTALFPTPEAYTVAINEWGLILDGVDAVGIERALQRCLTAFVSYPPKPAEFLILTRPTAQELGLPPLEEAFKAAVERRWRMHAIVWHVVTVIGQYEFGLLSQDEASKRFGAVYEQLVEQVAKQRQSNPGFELKIPETATLPLGQDAPKCITAPGDARVHIGGDPPATKASQRDCLERIRQSHEHHPVAER
ncbi:MAG: hypothetical protein R3F37_21135 [Candidatus Competibacteraceae bacterium]